MATITFCKQNRSLQIKEGTELLRLHDLDRSIPLKFGCRQGHCGTCAIKVLAGAENLSPKTKQEKATLCRLKLESDDCRLACQCGVKGDMAIDI